MIVCLQDYRIWLASFPAFFFKDGEPGDEVKVGTWPCGHGHDIDNMRSVRVLRGRKWFARELAIMAPNSMPDTPAEYKKSPNRTMNLLNLVKVCWSRTLELKVASASY